MKKLKKNYIKIIIIFIFIITFMSSVMAQVISESDFKAYNFSEFVINKNENVCKTYEFDFAQANINNKVILTLNIKNYTPINDGIDITVYLNEKEITKIINENIKQKNYIYLENVELKNKLNICVNNVFLPKLTISENSTIGEYALAELKSENFYKIIPNNTYVNSIIPITVNIENTGNNDVEIELINAYDEYLKNANLQHVSGNISYKGVLKAYENKKITYYVKINYETLFITPRAILTYTNEFGEKVVMHTEQHVLNIVEKENKLNVFLDIPKQIIINETYAGKLIIQNDSENEIENVFISTNIENNIKLSKININKLKAYEVVEIPFVLNSKDINVKEISFNIYYLENGINKETNYYEILNFNSNKKYLTETIISFILVFVILFIWLIKIENK